MTVAVTLTCAMIGISHTFGPKGGAFGRSRKCDWVLPDPNRILSSVHARIAMQRGAVLLIDESTNGTFLAGQTAPIGRGRSIALVDGMMLQAGPYDISVSIVHQHSTPVQAEPVLDPYVGADHRRGGRIDDQLRLGGETYGAGVSQKQSLDPLDYLGGSSPVNAPQTGPQTQSYPGETGRLQIPDNAAFTRPRPTESPVVASHVRDEVPYSHPKAPRLPDLPLPGSQSAGPASGIGHAYVPAPGISSGPTAPQAPTGSQPVASDVIPEDFLSMLTGSKPEVGAGTVSAAPATSSAPSIGAPIIPAMPLPPATGVDPLAMPPSPMVGGGAGGQIPVSPTLMPPTVAAGTTAGSSAALDHLEALKQRRDNRLAALDHKARQTPGPSPVDRFPASSGPVSQPDAPEESAVARMRAQGSNRPTRTQSQSELDSQELVLRALLSGLGFPKAAIQPNDAEKLAHDVGGMARELASGMITLLAARKNLKAEFRMDETRIEPEENNPFKYFKVGELALDEMLLTRKEGFLAPVDATRAAFQDLQNHTMATMAAMQRAMRLLFERLSPDALAGDDDEDGGLRIRGLGGRKGKWEIAKQNHDRMRADFDALVRQTIMEAFAQIQEEQARQHSKSFWENRKK